MRIVDATCSADSSTNTSDKLRERICAPYGPRRGSQHPAYQRPPTTKEIRRQRATTPIFIRERAPPQGGTKAYQAHSRDAFNQLVR